MTSRASRRPLMHSVLMSMHSCSNSRVARAAPHRQVMLQKYL